MDPFRIQVLTLSLDSQAVLTLVGLVVAGLVFRLAAGHEGVDLRAGDWWDVVTWAIVGGRLVWVLTHPTYYLSAPLQTVVITDGGLHPVGLVLGAAYAVRRLRRRTPRSSWRLVVDLVALAAVVTLIFERAGCALTTCGGGALTDLPWALLRGDERRQPVALYQLVVLAPTLLIMADVRAVRGSGFWLAFGALGIIELLSLLLGSGSTGDVLALGAALALYLVAGRRAARSRS